MIAVKKDFENIPKTLTYKKKREAFQKNKGAEKYIDETSKYRTREVKERLSKIYNYKCVYCEKSLLDITNHIEHYRPKSVYYQLAYSWDNLLLACDKCNSKKLDNFKIAKEKYNFDEKDYSLEELQNKIKEIDEIEEPFFVNPEQENQEFFDKNISFYLEGKEAGNIFSENERLKYTIETCDLNRDDLNNLRLIVLNDLKNDIKEIIEGAKEDNVFLVRGLKLLKQKINRELENKEREFTALRKIILDNFFSIFMQLKPKENEN